jgi:hypothetical protein
MSTGSHAPHPHQSATHPHAPSPPVSFVVSPTIVSPPGVVSFAESIAVVSDVVESMPFESPPLALSTDESLADPPLAESLPPHAPIVAHAASITATENRRVASIAHLRSSEHFLTIDVGSTAARASSQ